jgi:glycosyltransferase involved in cell wall biosynthesis
MKESGLLILSPGFPADENESSCLPPIQQFCISVKKKYPQLQLTVIAFQYPFTRTTYKWKGITVHSLGGKNRPGMMRMINWLRAYRLMRTISREQHLEGVLSLWLTETALTGKIFCRLNGLKHYTWLQGQDAAAGNRYIKRMQAKGKELIAISEFNRAELKKNHGLDAFMVANNGLNEEIFPVLKNNGRKIDLLGVGSLIPLKNYETFIRIVHSLNKEHADLNCVIAGKGPEEQSLRELTSQLGLQNSIRFTGELKHEEVLRLMNDSRVFVHPSLYEGNSTVLIEALYNGCQVVSFQGLANEKIKNLHLCENEEQMKERISGLLLREENYESVKFNSMDSTAEKIIGLYL